jgi:nicotinamide mononucleotide transporter
MPVNIHPMLDWIINNYIEILAAVLGLAGVWLTTRQNIWCWPLGLMNVTLSMFVFFSARLYYDFILQIFYFALTLYGWYHWVFGSKSAKKVPVSGIRAKTLGISLLIITVSVIVMGWLAEKYTNASLPYWDAFTTAAGIIVTYWMARKFIEHWIAWVIIDLVCTVIYIHKELYAFSVLYFIFAVLAIYGYFQWKKDLLPGAIS